MIRVTDARARTLELRRPAARIVSLVPSQTELLASLGLDEEVVGLTRFCVRPAGWKDSKQIVGGTKTLRIDRVRALRPDLVLANREENTQADIETLDALTSVFVTDVSTIEEADAMIEAVALLAGRGDEGRSLRMGISEAFGDLPVYGRIRAAYLIWDDPLMTVGGDTFIHDVMRRGGFENVFGGRSRYPEISEAELADAAPDVLLLPDEPYPFSEEHAPRFRRLLRDAAVHCVDGQAFSWYGSRLIHSPGALRRLREQVGI
jgi:ABC-type Fe3+-hydroxamate transport system substrate-binding protein